MWIERDKFFSRPVVTFAVFNKDKNIKMRKGRKSNSWINTVNKDLQDCKVNLKVLDIETSKLANNREEWRKLAISLGDVEYRNDTCIV